MLQIVSLIRTREGVFLVWRLDAEDGAIGAPTPDEAVRLLRERFGAARCRAAAAALRQELAREVLLCA